VLAFVKAFLFTFTGNKVRKYHATIYIYLTINDIQL